MNYQLQLDINRPRAEVLALFLDPARLPDWQPDLVDVTPLSDGDPRDVGATARQIHQMGQRKIEITETITRRDDPETYAAVYEGAGMRSEVENQFTELETGGTRWVVSTDLTCQNLLMRAMTWVMPGMFKRQTRDFMFRFRDFAEGRPLSR
ncbi:MAG: SRPBCC family protein [Pseudomonadota bacterium]